MALGTSYESYVPKTRVLLDEAAIAAVTGLGHERALRGFHRASFPAEGYARRTRDKR